MKIAILGAGAMGSLYGGPLSVKNDVNLIDVWKEHVDNINTKVLK
jgi:2-dehydropantoate 2-reductase